MTKVFDAQTTDASSLAVDNSKRGKKHVVLQGGFGSGNVTPEVSIDGTTWVPVNGVTPYTVAGSYWFESRHGQLRLTLASATAATLTAWIG